MPAPELTPNTVVHRLCFSDREYGRICKHFSRREEMEEFVRLRWGKNTEFTTAGKVAWRARKDSSHWSVIGQFYEVPLSQVVFFTGYSGPMGRRGENVHG